MIKSKKKDRMNKFLIIFPFISILGTRKKEWKNDSEVANFCDLYSLQYSYLNYLSKINLK